MAPTMTSDIANMNQNPPTLDLGDEYPETRKRSEGLPVAGVYTFRVREDFPDEVFSETQKGDLRVTIAPTIADGPRQGYILKFLDLNNTAFARDGRQVSFLGDFLKACGCRSKLVGTDAIKTAVRSTAGQMFRGYLDWEAGRKGQEIHVKGMKNFPQNADGTYQSYVNHPSQRDAQGNPVKVWARLRITTFMEAR